MATGLRSERPCHTIEMKLSPAQINGLRLAKEGCLGVGRFHRQTEQALARRGLIEYEGPFPSGDTTGWSGPLWTLTDKGRMVLAEISSPESSV